MVDDKKFASIEGKSKKTILSKTTKGFYMAMLAPNSTKDGTTSDITVTGEECTLHGVLINQCPPCNV